jgi:outer membrane protein assembly factor BamE (lipoprotein component of BamABCDE complex)
MKISKKIVLLLMVMCCLAQCSTWLARFQLRKEQGNINLALMQKKLAHGQTRASILKQFGQPVFTMPAQKNKLIYLAQKTIGTTVYIQTMTLFFKANRLINSTLTHSQQKVTY